MKMLRVVRDNKSRKSIEATLASIGSPPEYSYNIVTQGKVSALASCNGKALLEQLYKIVGYNRFLSSHRVTRDRLLRSRNTLEQIETVLKSVEERLEALKLEAEEAKQHDTLEKRLYTCERVLIERRLKEVEDEIKRMQEGWHTARCEMADWVNRAAKADKAYKDIEEEIRRTKNSLQRCTEVCETEKQRREELLQQIALLGCEYKDLKKLKETFGDEDSNQQQKEHVLSQIENLSAKVKELESIINREEFSCIELNKTAQLLRSEQEWLYSLEAEHKNFGGSVKKRNDFLRSMIKTYTKSIASMHEALAEKRAGLEQQQQELAPYLNDKEQYPKVSEQLRENQAELAKKLEDAKMDEVRLTQERLDLRRSEAEQLNSIEEAKANLAKCEARLSRSAGRSKLESIQNMNSLWETLSDGKSESLRPNYIGVLIGLLRYEPSLQIVMNVVGNKLNFYHVVRTDKCVTQLLRLLTNKYGFSCEHNFIALNRLRVTKRKPVLRANENVSARYPMHRSDGFNFGGRRGSCTGGGTSFGGVLIVKNESDLEIVFSEYKVDCITLSGDFLRRSGVLSGGYYSVENNSVITYTQYNETLNRLSKISENLEAVQQKLKDINTQHEQLCPRLQKLQLKFDAICEALEQIEQNRPEVLQIVERKSALIRDLEKEQSVLEASIEVADKALKRISHESSTGILHPQKLSTSEAAKLQEITQSLERCNTQLRDKSHHVKQLEHERDSAVQEIRVMLEPKLQELEKALRNPKEIEQQLASKKNLIVALRQELDKIDMNSAEISNTILEYESRLKVLEQRLNDLSDVRIQLEDEGVAYQKAREHHLTKIETTNAKHHDLSSRMRQLRAVSREYDVCSKMPSNWLEKEVKRCRDGCEELKENVNLKARDMFKTGEAAYTKARNQFSNMTTSFSHLKQLRNEQRDKSTDQIQYNLQLFATGFPKMFKKLVPHGTASITFTRTTSGSGDSTMTFSEENSSSISTSFNSASALSTHTPTDQLDDIVNVSPLQLLSCNVNVTFEGSKEIQLQHLSGGQRSITALALILTIQELDPARFYIFDEIDADLDPSRRAKLAELIASKGKNTQFICASFHKDIPSVANHIYYVKHKNNASKIRKLTPASALNTDQNEE